jgi:predicted small metal-binding protein
MSQKVECPCGATMRGDDDDELVSNVQAHVRAEHPEMADSMTREQILGMATTDAA